MNLPHLRHRPNGDSRGRSGFTWPRLPFRPNLSLSTRLTLLVVIPLVLTLAVTLPLTVTGLNKLAAVTGAERLETRSFSLIIISSNLRKTSKELPMTSQMTQYCWRRCATPI